MKASQTYVGADAQELGAVIEREWRAKLLPKLRDERRAEMKISDDIRKVADEWDVLPLYELADRIDREMVELPRDRDGVPIHVGDTLDGYGKTIEVVELRYGRSGWVPISRDGNGYADTFTFAHHHEPTVEDVLREFGDWYAHTKGGCDEDGIVAEYAAKLRLAGENA